MGRRRLVATLAAAGVLAAAGCGGEGGGAGDSGVALVPGAAALFVAVDTDFEGGQWQAAENLAARFPAGREALSEFQEQLAGEELDFERDVEPAVGPEVDVVLLDSDRPDDVVVLTEPRDEAKWRRLVASTDEPAVTEELEDGWWIAAETRAAIDSFKDARGGDSLAESDGFAETTARLPDERLATLFVSGAALTAELDAEGDLDADERGALGCLLGDEGLPSLAFALTAEGEGVRVSAAVPAGDAELPDAAGSELVDRLPAGAVAVLAAPNLAEQARASLRCAAGADEGFSRMLAQVEAGLGLSLDEDVLPLFGRETALAVYPASGAGSSADGTRRPPVAALVTLVDDEGRARDVADRIAGLASFAGEVERDEVEIAGVTATEVTIGESKLLYAVFDGVLVVTSAEEGISRLREAGERLGDDGAFRAAREAAGAPAETTGFAYADLDATVDLALGLAGAGEDAPDLGFAGGADVRENLEPLRSLFLWGEADDDVLGLEGFLALE